MAAARRGEPLLPWHGPRLVSTTETVTIQQKVWTETLLFLNLSLCLQDVLGYLDLSHSPTWWNQMGSQESNMLTGTDTALILNS